MFTLYNQNEEIKIITDVLIFDKKEIIETAITIKDNVIFLTIDEIFKYEFLLNNFKLYEMKINYMKYLFNKLTVKIDLNKENELEIVVDFYNNKIYIQFQNTFIEQFITIDFAEKNIIENYKDNDSINYIIEQIIKYFGITKDKNNINKFNEFIEKYSNEFQKINQVEFKDKFNKKLNEILNKKGNNVQ